MSWFSAVVVTTILLCSRSGVAAQQGVTRPAITPAPPVQKVLPSPVPSAQSGVPAGYIIAKDDSIQVTVWKEPTLSGSLLVRPDGMVTLPLLGDVEAAGLAPEVLSRNLTERFKKYISDPLVSVTVVKVTGKQIFLLGEVARVGPLSLTPGLTVLQAFATAGGLSPYAHAKKIYILRTTAGKQQKIPFDYKKALKDGNLQGITLLPDDTIVVP
jgi:polysaccharide export outer membrane protein